MRKILALLLLSLFPVLSFAQLRLVRENRQVSMNDAVPKGNYSGIAHIDSTLYAVVSDKSDIDGFYLFDIVTDSLTGEVTAVYNRGFRGDSTLAGGDCEAIVYLAPSNTFLVAREADNRVVEFDIDGKLTGRELKVPDMFRYSGNGNVRGNYGFESLAADEATGLIWTVTESALSSDGLAATSVNGIKNRLRLQSYGYSSFQPIAQYAYLMDAPTANADSRNYAMGVSELTALPDGRLFVLEREFFVARNYLGSYVVNKIYEVNPSDGTPVSASEPLSADSPYLAKRLVCEFETKLSLVSRSIANYEGMCLGQILADGTRSIVLVSDSQNRYRGVLRDWVKTIVVE